MLGHDEFVWVVADTAAALLLFYRGICRFRKRPAL
jgi:hypothetical protein